MKDEWRILIKNMEFYKITLLAVPKIHISCTVASYRYRNRLRGSAEYLETTALTDGDITFRSVTGEMSVYPAGSFLLITPDMVGETSTPPGELNRHTTTLVRVPYTYEHFDTSRLSREEFSELVSSADTENCFLLPKRGRLDHECSTVLPMLERISRHFARRDVAGRSETVARYLLLLSELTRITVQTARTEYGDSVPPSAVRSVERAIAYIGEHYKEKITAPDIADAVGLSVNYLHRIFEKVKGVTIINYLTSYRIEKARNLIEAGDAPAYEIAAEVGYTDPFYFSRVFRNTMGISFSEYKKQVHGR